MPASDRDTDLLLLEEAARAAGRVALTFTGPSARRWDKPDNLGPVTEADMAVNAVLEAQLTGARPDYGWLSEESTDSAARLTRDRVFIVDPIDGTRSFIEGADTWAHSIAIAERGEVVAAAVYLPVKGKLYSAAAGRGAYLNARPIRASRRDSLDGATMLAAKPNYDARHWPGGVPKVVRHYRPSLAYRLALVAEGRFDAMITLRPTWDWDIAAGALIAAEAGALATDAKGAALRFNSKGAQSAGCVVAPGALHGDFLRRLGQG